MIISPPAGSRGRALVGVWERSPKNVMSWGWKTTYGEKNKSIRTDILYDNMYVIVTSHTIIIVISSIRRFMFPAIFVLKYKTQSAGSRARKIVTMD